MTTINLGRVRTVWKGAWAATTAYVVDDMVQSSGNSYMCILAHTSGGAFATGSNWELLSAGGTDGTDGTDVGTGTAGQTLATAAGGSTLEWVDAAEGGGLKSVQAFTASGTWTRPAGVSTVRVQLVGSGAHGSNGQRGGGAGGYAEKICDVSSLPSVTVTVGTPNGNTSSFGTYVSATGGYSAGSVQSARGGFGGDGTGGDINIVGGGGGAAVNSMSATGGSSYFGGCTPGSPDTTDATLHTYIAYGAGGMGVYNGYTQGSATKPGLVIIWEYA